MSNNDININIGVNNKASGPIKDVSTHLAGMGKEVKETGQALRKFAANGKAGAISMGALVGSLAEVGKMGAMVSTALTDSMSKMARAIDPSINKSRVLTTNMRELMRVSDNPVLKQMGAHYRDLERTSKGASSGSRVLTTTMQDMMRVPVNTVLKDMGRHYRELERTSKKAGKPIVDVADVMNRQGREAFFAQSRMKELTGATSGFAGATKEVTSETKKATSAIRGTGGAAKKTKRDFSDLKAIGSDAGGHLKSVFNGVARVVRRSILVGVGAASVAMAGLVRTGIRYNGQMQTYQTMMTTYLKDSKQAAALILEAQKFAMNTPLDTKSVMTTATRLIQYGASAKDAMKMTKQLADVSAGSSDKMNSLGLAMAQIASKTRLSGDNLKQLTEAGYNPMVTMAKQTGKSMAELGEMMHDKLIPFEMVKKALEADTAAGGKFFGNVVALSKTLPGATANIKEMASALAGDATTGLYGLMTKSAVATQSYMSILTNGVLAHKGWSASLNDMTSAMRRNGGAAAWAAAQIDKLVGSRSVKAMQSFTSDVSATFAENKRKMAVYQSQVRTMARQIAKHRGAKMVTKLDMSEADKKLARWKPKPVTLRAAVRASMEKTKGGSKALKVFDGLTGSLQAMAPVVKGAMKFMAPMFGEIGKRVVKLIKSFRDMAPFFTNIIGPLIKGVFKGILSVIDPIISIIGWLAPWIGKLGVSAKPFSKYIEKVGYVIGMLFGGPILSGIGKFTKGFGLIGKLVRPLGGGLTKVAGVVGKLVGVVARFVGGFVRGAALLTVKFAWFFAGIGKGFFSVLSFPAKMYLKFVGFVAKMVVKFIGAIPRMANGFFNMTDKIGGRLGKMVQGFIRTMIKGLLMIREKFGSFASFIGNAIGHGVISIINGVIGQINKLFDGVEKIINKIPGVSVNMPTIGRVGGGGSDGGGGSAGSVSAPVQSVVIRQPAPAAGAIGGGAPFSPFTQSRHQDRDIVVQIDGKEIARATAKEIVRKRARA